MAQLVVLALSGLMLIGCGAAASPSPSAAPASASPGSPSRPPPPSAASDSPSASTETTLRLFDCNPTGGELSCPMSPGLYVAEIHDRFSLEIKDPGWQEERINPEDLQNEEPTLWLNRSADPNQRLMIDTGPTGGSISDAQLLPDLTGLQVGTPAAVQIGGTTGFQVDLSPSKSVELSVPVVPDTGYQLEPGNNYRLIVTQLPMGEESGIKVVLISAPTDAWNAFLPLADSVIQTLNFE